MVPGPQCDSDGTLSAIMSDEADLIERWRAGDADAGAKLCQRYLPDIERFFAGKIGREAEELVQATFLACIEARERFRGDSSFRTFLFGIARRQMYAFFRGRRRQDLLDFSVTSLLALDTGPITHAARNEEHRQLLDALQELPLEQQLLIELYYWEEMSSKDLAEIFDISQATVHTRLSRARRVLRKHLVASKGKQP